MSHASSHHPRPSGAHRLPPARAAKPRRPFGDPVAPVKGTPRFIPPPMTNLQYLNLALHAVMPDDAILAAGKIVFHAVGDTGGVHGTDVQEAIADRMQAQVEAADEASRPSFFYHLGDVIYFNGQSDLYPTQFYEPYQFYQPFIFAIPGNHDGDTRVARGDPPDTEPSLRGFMENFCDIQPHANSAWRSSMTQPYVYWTLEAPFVTIVGLYSNVDGSLDGRGTNEQRRWLEWQLRSASTDACLIVAVHHPPYSLDRFHGGSPDIGLALDRAIQATGRFPDAVLSGHVHNYQRFTRKADGRQIPYVVAGAGGFANTPKLLHQLQTDEDRKPIPTDRPFQTTEADVVLDSYNESDPGFLRITVDGKKKTLVGEYFLVPFDGDPPSEPFDTFTLNWKDHKLR